MGLFRNTIAALLLSAIAHSGSAQSNVLFQPVARIGVAETRGHFDDNGASLNLGGARFGGIGVRFGMPAWHAAAIIHAELTSSTQVEYASSPPCAACRPTGPAVNILMSGLDVEGLIKASQTLQLRLGLGIGTRQLIRIAAGCAGPCQPDPTDAATGVLEGSINLEHASGRHVFALEAGTRSGPLNGRWLQTFLLGLSAGY